MRGGQHISNIKMDGNNLTAFGAIYIHRRSNVTVNDCSFENFRQWGVFFCGGITEWAEPTIYAKGNKFHDNIVFNCSIYYPVGQMTGEGKGALGISGQDGLLIYNNNLEQTSRAGDSNGYLIKGRPYNKGIKIHDNIITAAVFNNTTYDFSIELWDCRGGVEIYNNKIRGCIDIAGNSTTKGSYPYGVYIHHNEIGPEEVQPFEFVQAITLEQNLECVIIENNHIKNVAMGIFIIQMVGSGFVVDGVTIRYNLFENLGVSDLGDNVRGVGITYFSDKDDHIYKNIDILNNTFVGHVGQRTTSYGILLPGHGTVSNIKIRNNIIKGFNHSPIYSIENLNLNQSVDNLSIENNIIYQSGYYNDDELVLRGPVPTNYVFQNNIKADPLLVSATDLHLKLGSPAINAGIDVGLISDYEGYPIIGLPDIGAYEWK